MTRENVEGQMLPLLTRNKEVTSAVGLIICGLLGELRDFALIVHAQSDDVASLVVTNMEANACRKKLTRYAEELLTHKATDGYVLVPRTPTRRMIAETVDKVFDGAVEDVEVIENIWRAMVEAAPREAAE